MRIIAALFCASVLAGCARATGPSPLPAGLPNGARALGARLQPDIFKVLYSFKGAPDGELPYGGLSYAHHVFYGTTQGGGPNLAGSIYQITGAGTETVLYGFGGSDGGGPYAKLLDIKGTFYGTTSVGGTNNDGTVFKVTASGGETTLYSFKGGTDGDGSYAGLADVNGVLYGTTFYGGASGNGTVFRITRSGKESVLYSFSGGADGSNPDSGLIAVNGNLYGATYFGGANNLGTVYTITTSGQEKLLHSFKGGATDGASSRADLVDVNGILYGTTIAGGRGSSACYGGCGTVFSVTPSGTETMLYAFKGGKDGAQPASNLIDVNGTLYGTTTIGGGSAACYSGSGCGTVFKVTTSGSEGVRHRFNGPDGKFPYAGLTYVNGRLYGTAIGGGASNSGTVFKVSP